MEKNDSENFQVDALKEAIDFLDREAFEIREKARLFTHHVAELCAGIDPNQACKPIDVVKIVQPLIEKEVRRLLACQTTSN